MENETERSEQGPAGEAPAGKTPGGESRERELAGDGPVSDSQEPETESWWSAYWERFRRQLVDDPVDERREGLWDRFERQEVDDPVDRRAGRRSG